VNLPTSIDIERIARRREPVIRNLQITQCYHELSLALAARTDGGANWCTFATWASKQAGQSIRKEDLARALERALMGDRAAVRAVGDVTALARPRAGERARERLHIDVWGALNPFAAVERVSAAVAQGNRKVFAEIGYEFARFLATCARDSAFDARSVVRFCSELRDGDPPGGQRYLRQAFSRYYNALFERDLKARSELLLHANLEIGFHEQTRLQSEIQAALNASNPPPEPTARRVLAAVLPAGSANRSRRSVNRLRAQPQVLDIAVAALLSVVRKHMREFLTTHLMTLWLPPDVTLHLGSDLRGLFPVSLRTITRPDLAALLAIIDPTPDSLLRSGAKDWGDLFDRLHFIADLFRCYHDAPDLARAPFAPEQVEAIKAVRLPLGPL
jgi:hypothetical protein